MIKRVASRVKYSIEGFGGSTLEIGGGYFWQRSGGKRIIIGLTSKALAKAGDVFSLELPRRGIFLEQGDPFVALTTANGVLELVSPLKGYVVEVNWELEKTPELLASVCDSWIVIMIPTGG